MTITQTRAAILAKTIEKFRAAGVPVDADPILHNWLETWVDGGLKMSDIAQRYQDLLKTRLSAKLPTDGSETAISAEEHHQLMNQHELLEEVARLLAESH